MATPASVSGRPERELKVLSLGMTRTGESAKLAFATSCTVFAEG